MTLLALTLACGDYDRTAALQLGVVTPEGIDLNYIALPVEETFWRMSRNLEFDASEMSLGSYLIRRSRGIDDLIAIPAFVSRFFRHCSIYTNAAAGIQKPQDLKGKRMGVPEYQMTAAIWIRGLLQHEYGLPPSDIRWFQGGLYTPGRIEKQHVSPPGVKVETIPAQATLSQMLAEGEIDALVAACPPSTFLDGTERVQRLFPNFKEVEREYYLRTGIFPIMHVVVIRRPVLEAHPWVAQSLFKAFCKAKERLYEQFTQSSALRVTLPWMLAEYEEARALLGEDFWPYGFEGDAHTLQTLIDYADEQGLTERKLKPEELFAPNTLEGFKI